MMRGTALLLLLCISAPLRAEPDEAEHLWQKGVAYRRQRNEQAAYECFQRLFDLVHTARARAQLGLAAQALSHWLEAEEHLRLALAATDDPWIARHRLDLEEAAAYVAEHLGSLTLSLTPEDAEIAVDGAAAQRVESARLRLPIGNHQLEVSKTGYESLKLTVTVEPGSTALTFTLARLVVAQLPPTKPATPAVVIVRSPPPTRRATPTYKKWWLWSSVGLVVATGVAVGVGLGVAAAPHNQDFRPTLPPIGGSAP